MKKLAILACLLAGGLFCAPASYAQVRFNVNVNVGNQPTWGPVGYDYAQYYYLPDIGAYYYIPDRQFIYFDEDADDWVFAPSLPRYYHYDLYRGYKVVINEPRPYLRDDYYRTQYRRYKGCYGKQVIIRDCRDERYRRHHDDDDDRGRGHGRWKEHGHHHRDDD